MSGVDLALQQLPRSARTVFPKFPYITSVVKRIPDVLCQLQPVPDLFLTAHPKTFLHPDIAGDYIQQNHGNVATGIPQVEERVIYFSERIEKESCVNGIFFSKPDTAFLFNNALYITGLFLFNNQNELAQINLLLFIADISKPDKLNWSFL